MIKVNYKGRLGNNLFQYSLGRIISKELDFKLSADPIPGFDETYKEILGKDCSFNTSKQHLEKHIIDLKSIIQNKSDRKIILNGYFQRYEYYEKYSDEIKKWLYFKNQYKQLSNDLVVHIRRDDYITHGYTLTFESYKKMIESVSFNKIYITTDSPNDVFLKKFDAYNPVIVNNSCIEDFKFISSFNKIIISQSSYSWWAAFLSNATEIIFPVTDFGIWGEISRPDIDLKIVDESRYKYIKV